MTASTRASELVRSEAFASAPIAYSLIDLEGTQVGANAAFREMFRTGENRSSAHRLTHPDDAERTASYLAALVAGEVDKVTVDKRYLRADGTMFWGRLTATALLDETGRAELLLGVIEDISPQMEAVGQLQAVSDSKSAFVARVCHDLRAPLHAIAGLSELLATGDQVEPGDRRLAEGIGRETQALQVLVDELLDLSRVEAGTLAIERSVFALDQCINDALEILGPRAAENGLDLELETSGQVTGSVMGDGGRLRQILINLLDNAIKFTASGGVHLAVDRTGDLVTFAVRDSGPGIAPQDLDHIFETFAQFHDDRSGSGLGLAISSDLAQAMDGALTVESTLGEGSTFTLSLPLPVIAGDDGGRPETGRAMVLVVEDSPVNQLLVTNQLDRLGHDCVIAEDGFEALRIFETGQGFALVFMDWHLPGIDGLETTRRLRRIEAGNGWQRTPVVGITARAMAGDREQCLDAGMDDVVTKPASLDDIRGALAQWARKDRSPRTAAPRSGTDTRVLEQLLDELGDPAVIHKLIETYLEQLPERQARIAAGIANHDLEDVRRAAHTLKSTSAVVGAWKLEQASRTLEDLASKNGDGLKEAAALLESRIDETAATLREVATSLESR